VIVFHNSSREFPKVFHHSSKIMRIEWESLGFNVFCLYFNEAKQLVTDCVRALSLGSCSISSFVFKDSVLFLCPVVRRDFCSALWAIEIAFSPDFLHVNSEQLARLHDTIPPLLSFASAEPKMLTEQCSKSPLFSIVAVRKGLTVKFSSDFVEKPF
jgi:hypothetical protein